MFDSKIESVIVEKLNLDLECYYDLLLSKGIRLTSTDAFDKKNEKVYSGLQSEFFGTDFGDDSAFAERYSCKCKKYVGKMYSGTICELCNTTVDHNDTDLTKTGWIMIDHFSVVSPIYGAKLIDALGTADGEKVFDKIIEVGYDEDGNQIYNEKDLALIKKHPFIHKGLIWLKDNIMEVLEFYEKRKPNKAKLFKELKNDIDKIFTKSIPVYSAVLRTELPGVKGNKQFKMKINTIYQSIIRISNFINRFPLSEIDDKKINTINIQLADIQGYLLDIFDVTYKELSDKKGIIQGKILGGRYNYSARNIIVPSSGRLRADEIELGYITFMELFRPEIINFYTKIQNCTIMEASNVWKKGLTHYNATLYNIMQHMVTDPECKKYVNVLISRNPCINYGSFQCVKVANVKPDINDKTMTISSPVLKTLGADFDGDVLNIFRIFGEDFYKRFAKNLNPRYNLYISRIDGKVNKDTMPFKDENIAFYQFNNI